MNTLYEGVGEVCRFMSERSWQFCIIGGLAVQRWGEPRTTLDADIGVASALLPFQGGCDEPSATESPNASLPSTTNATPKKSPRASTTQEEIF